MSSRKLPSSLSKSSKLSSKKVPIESASGSKSANEPKIKLNMLDPKVPGTIKKPLMPSKMNKSVFGKREFDATFRNQTVKDDKTDGLEMDLAYNRYLQTMLVKREQDYLLEEKDLEIQNYLIERNREFYKTKNEILSLEEKREEVRLKVEIKKLKKKIINSVNQFNEIFNDDVKNKLKEFEDLLKNIKDNLYLENVQVPKTEDELEKLNDLLIEHKNCLIHIQESFTEKELCHEQAYALQKFENLRKEFNNVSEQLIKLDKENTGTTLKVMSDTLAKFVDS